MEEQWMSIKGIAGKYQMDEEELEELVKRQWVTSSEIGRTTVIDENCFLAYLELHRRQANRTQVIEKLNQLNAQLNTKLRICEEANATYVVTDQLLPLYPLIINILSLFLKSGRLRDVFYSLAKGEHIESVSKRYGTNIKMTLQIYNFAIRRLKLRAMAHFEEATRHGTCIEILDRHYIKANIKYKKLCLSQEKEKEEMKKECARLSQQLDKLRNKENIILNRIQDKNKVIRELRYALHCEEEKSRKLMPVLYVEPQLRQENSFVRLKNFFSRFWKGTSASIDEELSG